MECRLEVMEEPAERVKFRVEPPGQRCQQQELLLGRVTLTTTTKHCKKGFGQMKNGWVPKVSM